MPSGAKKRKAARKKKEKETNHTNNPQGNDGLKSVDEKGSDGGEGDSPAYHEHDDHHHPFSEAKEEVEERDPLAAQPLVSDVKSMQEVPVEVEIDQVLGGKESFLENESKYDTKNGESLIIKNSNDENCVSVEEAIACHEFVKSIDSSPPKTVIGENIPVEETIDSATDSSVKSTEAVASVSKVENTDTSLLLEKSVVHPVEVTNIAMKTNEDSVYSLANENVTESCMEEPKPKESDCKVLDSSSASPFTKFTNDAEHVKDSETAESSEHQPRVVSAPNVVQKTSWLSCCGLFEVMSSSN